MSLSTLLGGTKPVDTELDALFTAKPPVASKAITQDPAPAPPPTPGSSKETQPANNKRKKSTLDAVPQKRVKTGSAPKEEGKKAKGKKRQGRLTEDENSDLENAYVGASVRPRDVDSDEGEVLEHETVTKAENAARRRSAKNKKVKYVPADETPELRDQRTIFVGNLSVQVAQKKSLLKQLHRHILSSIPTAKIESTRFRSVPFQVPTSTLPDDADGKGKGKADPKPARQHDIERASTWRSSSQAGKSTEAEAEAEDEEKKKKSYLTPNQKKKIAFIKHEFHTEADTANAYVVFAHPVPVPTSVPAKNVPPPAAVLDPREAARRAVRACDGSTFMGRVLRVDFVGKNRALPAVTATATADEDADMGTHGADPRSTVFVGNLDFASKEEDLRVFFEGVVAGVRGPPPAAATATATGTGNGTESRPRERDAAWVVRVRIVRDRDTQLGKGFAYVQFIDHECVDEVVALDPAQLKFAKRKLRVQRCRTLPGSSASTRQATASKPSGPAAAAAVVMKPPAPIVVPKGDPALGEKLAHLSKDARKQYKSGDADRVARRLAKKKARMAMAAGDKAQGRVKERARERVRKRPAEVRKKAGNTGTKKGRVRSERSLMKRNGKKAPGISA